MSSEKESIKKYEVSPQSKALGQARGLLRSWTYCATPAEYEDAKKRTEEFLKNN